MKACFHIGGGLAESIPNVPVIWSITMKKKLLLLLLLPICLGGCSLEEYKAKKHIIDTKWSCVDDAYIPHCSYELSLSKDSYELCYHKDAVQTPNTYEEAVDKKVSGKWSYFRSLSKSWIGDWSVKQSVTYHVVQIECQPRYDDVGYLYYEIGSNVMYMQRKEPSSIDDMLFSTRFRLKE